jgi:hypothetical protein
VLVLYLVSVTCISVSLFDLDRRIAVGDFDFVVDHVPEATVDE